MGGVDKAESGLVALVCGRENLRVERENESEKGESVRRTEE